MMVVGGVSSHGKTSFAERITEEPLRRRIGVGWISADTDRAGLIERMACQRAGVCANDFAMGRVSADELAAVTSVLAELDGEPLQIVDNTYDWSVCKVAIDRMIAFYEGTDHWLQQFDHNHLRITRILQSIGLLLGASAAQKFYDRLMALHDSAGAPVNARSLRHWRDALRGA